MSVSEEQTIKRQPTQIPGLYTWNVRASDIGDGTGGNIEIRIRFNSAGDPTPSLWYYLTEIWITHTVVTSQPTHIEIRAVDFPNLVVDRDFGMPAPAMSNDEFGGTRPLDAIFPKPMYLGIPATDASAQIRTFTTNTDTLVALLEMRGFATQYPIDPLYQMGQGQYK